MIDHTELELYAAVETLDGYDEQFIEEQFGQPIEYLLATRSVTAARAVATILIARPLAAGGDLNAKGNAYKHVMTLSIKQVNDFFPDPVPEDGGNDPEQPSEAPVAHEPPPVAPAAHYDAALPQATASGLGES